MDAFSMSANSTTDTGRLAAPRAAATRRPRASSTSLTIRTASLTLAHPGRNRNSWNTSTREARQAAGSARVYGVGRASLVSFLMTKSAHFWAGQSEQIKTRTVRLVLSTHNGHFPCTSYGNRLYLPTTQ
jgi:hypothetical protein